MNVIGVDPGKLGGMAVASEKVILDSFPFKNKTHLEIHGKTAEWIRIHEVTTAYIENVHSMPYQSAQSTFTFGKELAKLETCMSILSLNIKKIDPRKWQRRMLCLTGGDKKVSYQRAKKLFPYIKITHQIADACLIASYAAKIETPGFNFNIDELYLSFTKTNKRRKNN